MGQLTLQNRINGVATLTFNGANGGVKAIVVTARPRTAFLSLQLLELFRFREQLDQTDSRNVQSTITRQSHNHRKKRKLTSVMVLLVGGGGFVLVDDDVVVLKRLRQRPIIQDGETHLKKLHAVAVDVL